MATFLELCQKVAQESGTVADLTSPTSVTGQTGRLKRVVDWTRRAYDEIQNEHQDWRWMQADFEGSTIANTRAYDSTAMGITERFSHWVERESGEATDLIDGATSLFTVQDPALGREDEQPLAVWPWYEFRRQMLVGGAAERTGKPQVVAIDDLDRLSFYPLPDKAYTIRGRYGKGLQDLSANADVPEMPARYHDLILWSALLSLGNYDEAPEQMAKWAASYGALRFQLERHQKPRIRLGRALA